jgi:hypothetical protein
VRKNAKKLALHRETLQALDLGQLSGAVPGTTYTRNTIANSENNCTTFATAGPICSVASCGPDNGC